MTRSLLPLFFSLFLAACGERGPIPVAESPGADGAPPAENPIADYRGDWVFINYWAIWCKPCIKEIPELNALNDEPGFSVLGVNFDGIEGEALAEQVEKLSVDFPTLREDPGARFDVPRPQVLPTTLIVNPEGQLANVLIGPQTGESLKAAALAAGVE